MRALSSCDRRSSQDDDQLSSQTLHTLVVSEPWDSGSVGGDEVDVDWLLPAPEAAASLVAA